MFAFPPFIFYWQRDGSQLSKLFTTCWGLQLQFENISYFFTCRWFPKSWWVLTCIKILKNNLNDFFFKYIQLHSDNLNFVPPLQGEVTSPDTSAVSHPCKDHNLPFSTSRPRTDMDTAHLWGIVSDDNAASKGRLVRHYHSGCTRGQQQFVLQNSEDQHMAGWGFCPGYPNTGAGRKHSSIFVLFPLSAYLSSLKIL